MHYHAVAYWGGASTSRRSGAKLKYRKLHTPVPPEASHPLVVYDANGTATYASLLQAITNSAFDSRTGRLVAVGPSGVELLVRVHNAQPTARTVAPNSFSHLTNARRFRDRVPLKDLKRRTSSSRVHLYDETRTCISCNTHTSRPKKYASSGARKFILCPDCFEERTTMSGRTLVPLSLMASCFSDCPLLARMIRALSCVTRAGIMGISAGGTHRGLLLRLQPLGGMGSGPESGTKKKRFCAGNDYWWSLFPENTERANAWKGFVWRLSKAAAAHNRHPLALVATAAVLTSTGRATFPQNVVDRLWGKQGDLCMGMSAQAVTVDTKTTAYLTFRLPRETAVCVASVACVGVTRALFSGRLQININVVPECVGSAKREHRDVDARRSSGFPADVTDGVVSFCHGEAITHEHLWHCHRYLNAQTINVTGSVASATRAAGHVQGESTSAWKHGGVFHEMATTPLHSVNVVTDLLAWDAHEGVVLQKMIREERHTAPTQPVFKHPITYHDLCLVAARTHKFI